MPLGWDITDSWLQQFWIILKISKQFCPSCLNAWSNQKNYFIHFRCLLRVVVSDEKKFEKSQHLSLFWTKSEKTLKNHRQKCSHAIWIFFSDLISQRMYLSMKKIKKWHFFFVGLKTAIKVEHHVTTIFI